MKIIYHCYGGSHSSVTAAALHLGMLPSDKLPSLDMFMQIPYFDGQINKDHGYLRFMGNDEDGHQIYIVGRRNFATVLENCYYDLEKLFGFKDKILLIDVMPYVNWYMVVGGTASRKFGWVSIGRPIVLKGVQHAFFKIAALVDEIKLKIGGLK